MSAFKDISFSSVDSDFGVAVKPVLSASSEDEDYTTLSAASCDDTATTASSSLDAAAAASLHSGDEEELSEFLWDAFGSFESTVYDVAELAYT
jgi:hypothetical protein